MPSAWQRRRTGGRRREPGLGTHRNPAAAGRAVRRRQRRGPGEAGRVPPALAQVPTKCDTGSKAGTRSLVTDPATENKLAVTVVHVSPGLAGPGRMERLMFTAAEEASLPGFGAAR